MKFNRDRQAEGGHEVFVFHGLIEFVCIGGHVGFEPEEVIGIAVALRFWCGRQSHAEAIEVLEDGLIFIIYRPVYLIEDDEVEMPDSEMAFVVIEAIVDEVDHGLVGTKDEPGMEAVFFLGEINSGEIGQQFGESSFRLINERAPVCEEENALDPVAFAEDIHQCCCGACFTGAGGHDEEGIAAARFQHPPHRSDRFDLIVSIDDRRIDECRGERLSGISPLDEEFQFFFLIEAGDLPA